jgi:excisionase family DNA binding protein
MLDLTAELVAALASPAVEERLRGLLAEVVRAELGGAGHGGDPDQLLTIRQAAKLLGMTPTALEKAVVRGRVPVIRIGRRLRFRRSDLLRLATWPGFPLRKSSDAPSKPNAHQKNTLEKRGGCTYGRRPGESLTRFVTVL